MCIFGVYIISIDLDILTIVIYYNGHADNVRALCVWVYVCVCVSAWLDSPTINIQMKPTKMNMMRIKTFLDYLLPE